MATWQLSLPVLLKQILVLLKQISLLR